MVTTPWNENSPLQSIKFPLGGSSGVENGLKNLGWETWVYELGPLRGQAHSFHSSGWGWNIKPPAWDRRSLLIGSSVGGPSKRDIISGNHTLPGHREVMRSSRTRSRRTLSRTPGSRAIEGNAYRRSLGHVCTITSSPRVAGCVRENQMDSETSLEMQTDTLVPGRTSFISAPPHRGGASIPRASAPVSTGCLLLCCGPPGCKLLK